MNARKDPIDRLLEFTMRLAILVAAAVALVEMPEPLPDSVLHGKNAVVVFLFIIMLGKLILDTFFYDNIRR